MIHGIDTSFLVAVEVEQHPDHQVARNLLDQLVSRGDTFALAPQVLAEFIHVITDGRRFESPLSMTAATHRAERWWTADEVSAAYPKDHAVSTFVGWLREHQLGRKRLLDTLLAATYLDFGVNSILSTSARDFKVFGCFSVLSPS